MKKTEKFHPQGETPKGIFIIQQGVLPFKLVHSNELIMPRSGLRLFAEVIRTLKVDWKVRESFLRPG